MKSSTIHHIRILFSVYLTASYIDHTRCTQIVYCDIRHTKHFIIRAIYVYHNQLLINHQNYAQPFRVNMPYLSSVLMSKTSGTVASSKQTTSAVQHFILNYSRDSSHLTITRGRTII